jgi:hypothetical protein
MPISVPDANTKAVGRFVVEEKAVLIQTAIAAADMIDGTRIVIVFFFLVGSLGASHFCKYIKWKVDH